MSKSLSCYIPHSLEQYLLSYLPSFLLNKTAVVLCSLVVGFSSTHTLAHTTNKTDTYVIEQNNTNVRFTTEYMKGKKVTGGVYSLTGKLKYSNKQQQGYVNIDIPMTNISTFNELFTKNLKSDIFFDVKNYPTANFKSTKWHFITKNSEKVVKKIDGLLTLHGKTKTITLTAKKFDCYMSIITDKTVCGGDFRAIIDRSKWGIDNYLLLGVPKEVILNIEIKAIKR